jgi:hypothetical protein
MTGPKGYHWLHIPSGKMGTSEFGDQHAAEIGTILRPNGCLPIELAYELINKWNAQHPTLWKYWL